MTDDNQQQQEGSDQNQNAPEATFSKDDISDLLKQNSNGQQHISTLESETKQMRDQISDLQEEVSKRQTMEEMMAELRETPFNDTRTEPTASQVDENALLAKLGQQMSERLDTQQQEQTLQNNWNASMAALEQVHGEKYESYVDQRAKELDMSTDQIGQMAATSPKAFLDLMDTPTGTSAAPTTPSNRTTQSDPTDEAELSYSKIAKLQKNVNTDEGRLARETWNDPEWQKRQRDRMLAKARTEGSQFGNIIR